ncbi:L,D-transpeptidase family protein [Beggiatoa leptomitoformis]|uniref:L,D-transpeptidase family protein n=1 Tax=Beggiatoa leptomitoformis TaxID=288004 RepID=A0A2N9YIV2_9GAMM|nr:L,D-transpeptidase [Beggiatoa leptomitoformis]ALG69355.2 L,D-transpeptidase family protein [Beggiatoa leptomitoformis]AUI70452.1 L,D-transpeptidase family protein [Beggiatoa leptomitoformis]
MANRYLHIHLPTQSLHHLTDTGESCFSTSISSARNGAGEVRNSGCTPRGWLVIKAKVGANCAINSVFIGRRFTGEIYTPELAQLYPQRDWILSRILWLGGLEPNKNRYGQVDTLRRFIYIHGTPDDKPMGIADSCGCIRMRNHDIITLFDQVNVGTRVFVEAE